MDADAPIDYQALYDTHGSISNVAKALNMTIGQANYLMILHGVVKKAKGFTRGTRPITHRETERHAEMMRLRKLAKTGDIEAKRQLKKEYGMKVYTEAEIEKYNRENSGGNSLADMAGHSGTVRRESKKQRHPHRGHYQAGH